MTWIRRGRAGDEPFAAFVHKLEETEAETEEALLVQIRAADAWQSKAWILERRFPKRWALKHRTQADVRVTNEAPKSKEELEAQLRSMLAALASGDAS